MRSSTPKKSRRTPSQERSRQLARDIETAAAHVLAERGFGAASTARIAEKAGVSVGSIYQYFGSKEAIFESLAARLITELLAASHPLLEQAGLAFQERAERMFLIGLEVLAPYPTVLQQLSACTGYSFHRGLQVARLEAVKHVERLIASHEGELHVVDPSITARMLVDAAVGIVLNLQPNDDLARIAREVGRLSARYCTGKSEPSTRRAGKRRAGL